MRLDELLARSAASGPERCAFVDLAGGRLTYGELDAAADAVAADLRAAGVRPGDRVGLSMPKGLSSVTALFGILRAGAAYVPVDASGPAGRAAYIFKDGQVAAVVVSDAGLEALRAALTDPDGWRVSEAASMPPGAALLAPKSAPPPSPDAEGLAYILYTSGSTGHPKGVMHTHASALAFVDWCSEELAPTSEDRFTSHAPFHFDLSILDLYVSVKHGASVVLIAGDEGKQPARLAGMIAEHGVTVWYSTPTILRMLVEFAHLEEVDASSLRLVIFAGEVFPLKTLAALQARWPAPTYYNLYGPTETNVCTYYRLPPFDPSAPLEPLPIGWLCSSDEGRVVDHSGSEVARGEEGELIVAGGSVMRGYWNLPERNALAFFEADGRRWYHTGDMVRQREDGAFMYLGRRDGMVKRRGYRVELGEIEAALALHPSISEAAVVDVKDDAGDVSIHAFFTWRGEAPASPLKLKLHCGQHVPNYMLPDRLERLEELPKTSTHKTDYQALKERARGLRTDL